jgi:enoyl-CoA hydratase/carnithine racemase
MTGLEPATQETESRVLVSVKDHVGTITLDRPAKLNALDATMRRSLLDAFTRLEADDACRSIVLAASGRSFCVGADLAEMSGTKMTVPPRDYSPHLGRNVFVSKPVVAAVRGHAYGGGFLLAQMCDLCIAGESALFAIAEVRRGRGAPWAAPLITKVPERVMMEILLLGRPMSAQRAHGVGLVNAVVADDEVDAVATEWAREIAANAPLSVRAAKRLVAASCEMGRSAALDVGDVIYRGVYESHDAQEGPRAFVERRPPEWQGR